MSRQNCTLLSRKPYLALKFMYSLWLSVCLNRLCLTMSAVTVPNKTAAWRDCRHKSAETRQKHDQSVGARRSLATHFGKKMAAKDRIDHFFLQSFPHLDSWPSGRETCGCHISAQIELVTYISHYVRLGWICHQHPWANDPAHT